MICITVKVSLAIAIHVHKRVLLLAIEVTFCANREGHVVDIEAHHIHTYTQTHSHARTRENLAGILASYYIAFLFSFQDILFMIRCSQV